ncbi:MAG TPA: choice-of-anchor tandem repeat GloVer-containing protein [Candidatus Sulfotelmatobacter sp.]
MPDLAFSSGSLFSSPCEEKLALRSSTSAVCGTLCFLLAFVVVSSAQSYKIVSDFDINGVSGPTNTPVQGLDGNLYGAFNSGFGEDGIYSLTPNGTMTNVQTFSDYEYIGGALIPLPSGSFYGTTVQGGANSAGTIFTITPGGVFTLLHTFSTNDNHGSFPGQLILATSGNFYGYTASGGVAGNGTIFSITPAGSLRTVFTFDDTNGGAANSLIQGSDGNFYGTTYLGGADNLGTVFNLTPSGVLTTLHSFSGSDGSGPYGGLTQENDGNFYGVTIWGGDLTCNPATGCGSIFKITTAGSLTTLHNFEIDDGLNPYSALVQGNDGNLYGTTFYGGTDRQGTIFEITTGGTFTQLHSFDPNFEDGGNPISAPLQDTNGSFYGTTQFGGNYNAGVAYRLSVPGLGPFVRTLPSSGTIGSTVIVLGTGLTGATSVDFAGTAASFNAISSSEISAIVPAGSHSGRVHVTLPKVTLHSNAIFMIQTGR